LKVHLAQNLLNPNRPYIKEAVYVMDDMIKALEKGKISLSPRTRESYKIVGSPKKFNKI
jgi:hypothetical protein